MMNRMTVFSWAAALLMLAGCGSPQSAQETGGVGPGETSLEGARIGGPFTLTDQDGKPRSWDDFQGKYRLVYFGYTYCPDVCPVDLQRITQGYAQFARQSPERAAKVQPVFITVDPERDTAEVVRTYVGAFHPDLVGLTGTPVEIAAVAKQFAVVYAKENPEGASDYLVGHSRTPYLFGPDGAPLVMMPVDDPATDKTEGMPEDIAASLDRWVK